MAWRVERHVALTSRRKSVELGGPELLQAPSSAVRISSATHEVTADDRGGDQDGITARQRSGRSRAQ